MPTRKFEGISKTELFQQAKDLGAMTYNMHIINYNGSNQAFSYHFFNSDDLEIANFIPDLVEFSGLQNFVESPRRWSYKSLNANTPRRSVTEELLRCGGNC